MAKSNNRGKAICGGVRLVLEEQKLDRTTSRKADAKCSTRETLDAHHSGFHSKITIGKGLQLYISSVQ